MPDQTFSGTWPEVLKDVQEYVALAELSAGRNRPGELIVSLSRQRVAAHELQPHITGFRQQMSFQHPHLQLKIVAIDRPDLLVELNYKK